MIEHDHLFKVLLVGDSAVGKSSLVVRFADGKWNPSFVATIGVDFRVLAFEMEAEGVPKVIKLQIWDTAGQERFRAIAQSYYRGAHAVVVAFDATDVESLRNVRRVWLPEIAKFARDDVHIVLAANKMDLATASLSLEAARRAPVVRSTHGGAGVADADREEAATDVPRRTAMSAALAKIPIAGELEALCDEYRLDAMGVSARTGEGVEESFGAIVRTLLSEALAREALTGKRVGKHGKLAIGSRVPATDKEVNCCSIM